MSRKPLPQPTQQDRYAATKDAGVWDLAVAAAMDRVDAELLLAGAALVRPRQTSAVAKAEQVKPVDFFQPDLLDIFVGGVESGERGSDWTEAVRAAIASLKSHDLWDQKALHFERGSTWSEVSLTGFMTWFELTAAGGDADGFVRDQLPHACRRLRNLRYRMDQAEAMFRSATAMLAGDRHGAAVTPVARAKALVAASRLTRIPIPMLTEGLAQRRSA